MDGKDEQDNLPILNMPALPWLHILIGLSPVDKANLRQVCKRVRTLVNAAVKEVQVPQSEGCNLLDLRLESRFPCMTDLTFGHDLRGVDRVDDDTFTTFIQRFPLSHKLRSVKLKTATALSASSVAALLLACPLLERLSLPYHDVDVKLLLLYSHMTDACLTVLARFRHLKALDLQGCNYMTDSALCLLEDMTSLTHLNLQDCRWLGNIGTAALSGLAALRTLSLHGCSAIGDIGLASLAGLQQLEDLDLCGTRISNSGLAHLQHLTLLRRLKLSLHITPDGIYAARDALAGLDSLALGNLQLPRDCRASWLPSLTQVTLNGECTDDETFEQLLGSCPLIAVELQFVTDRKLRSLTKKSTLQSLCLRYCGHMLTEGMEALLSLPPLVSLTIQHADQLSDCLLLAALSRQPHLHKLCLTCCYGVSDAALIMLAPLTPRLERIEIGYCPRVTNAVLLGLAGLPKLEQILVIGCSAVNSAGRQAVHGAAPNKALRIALMDGELPYASRHELMP